MKGKKKNGKKWIVLLLVVVLAVGAGVFFFLRKRSGSEDSTRSSLYYGSVTTQEVTRGKISVTTEGNGSIEAAEEKTIASDYNVTIREVVAEEGDQVEEGDRIAWIDLDSIDQEIDQLRSQLSSLNTSISNTDKSGSSSVTSPVAGRVKRIFVKTDEVLEEVVKKYGGLMELSTDGKLCVCFKTSRDVSIGDEVRVTFQSYDVDGIIAACEEECYTVTFSDDASYQVDTEAKIYDENDNELGSGLIAANHPYYVDARYGIADEIEVSLGDYVDSGATLLTRYSVGYNRDYLDLVDERQEIMEKIQELQKLQEDPSFYADESGIISEMRLADHAPVTEDAAMYNLISTDSFWLKVQIDELDIAEVKVGQEATIVFDAFDDEEYSGSVEKISALGTNTGGVTRYTVTIAVPGIEKVKPAMSATATIIIREKEDVLLVPIDAVSYVDGQKCVTVQTADGTELRNVTLGLTNNTMAEVTEGLTEGEIVVVQTSSGLEDMISMMQQARASSGGEN